MPVSIIQTSPRLWQPWLHAAPWASAAAPAVTSVKQPPAALLPTPMVLALSPKAAAVTRVAQAPASQPVTRRFSLSCDLSPESLGREGGLWAPRALSPSYGGQRTATAPGCYVPLSASGAVPLPAHSACSPGPGVLTTRGGPGVGSVRIAPGSARVAPRSARVATVVTRQSSMFVKAPLERDWQAACVITTSAPTRLGRERERRPSVRESDEQTLKAGAASRSPSVASSATTQPPGDLGDFFCPSPAETIPPVGSDPLEMAELLQAAAVRLDECLAERCA
mmetsp:Transcript_6676/g.17005  ORF Transcript_6676/g.17005 Transcript_6676/m.17005 type:complete len:280 (-) Transcript_6676:280-1119(-)